MKYEKWSSGYWFLKQYVRFASWLIARKTIVTGKENIPNNKPIIFAPNHQNALSDPMAVLLHTRFQPVWLARADIFGKNRYIDAVLRFLKIIPVYRLRDGKENLDKNQQTFSVSIKVLEKNAALALFPEAAHSFKRQMMAHKKAVPRIVFLAEEQTGNKLDIQIIPTGIHYSHYWKFNRTLIINFGKPISANAYLESYSQNPNAATVALRNDLYNALLPLVINIKSKTHYKAFERIRKMYGKHFLEQQLTNYTAINQFKSDQVLVNRLDELEAADPDYTQKLALEANNLHEQIRNHGLRPWLVDAAEAKPGKLVADILLLLVSFPFFFYGFAFNILPFLLIDRLVRKKVKDKSFWSSFFLVGGIIIFPLFYIILLIAGSSFLPSTALAIAFLLSLPIAGKLAFNWFILLLKTIGRSRFIYLKWFKRKAYHELTRAKKQLFKKLDAVFFKGEYPR